MEFEPTAGRQTAAIPERMLAARPHYNLLMYPVASWGVRAAFGPAQARLARRQARPSERNLLAQGSWDGEAVSC